MATPLIIVESPSKARTLSRFLGPSYVVKASMGHVRDLPKSKMGVDVEKGFVPEYEVIKGKEQQIRELRSASKKADATLLAADPDREGEAIAWHIAEALKLRDPDRVVFHEITQRAVEAALASPRKIDRALVAAQEARRVIDRLVGYRLSPLLWKKVRTGLSAGRVQSVAVRLVVDRENEILAFVPRESWSIDALLSKEGAQFKARLIGERGQANAQAGTGSTPRKRGNAGVKGAAGGNGANPAAAGPAEAERLEVGKEDQARAIAQALGFNEQGRPGRSTPPFRVTSIETSESSRSAPFPYTTSTLQQDASTRLRFSPRRTMVLAQQLYEGLEVGHEGPVGLITYMRTDSTRISDTARADAADYIRGEYGKEYVRTSAGRQKARQNVQDAHEAIRPTDVRRTPESLASHLDRDQFRLYELVWRRYVASQMSPARFLVTRATIEAGDYIFRASGSVTVFDGFQRVWKRDEDRERDDSALPRLEERDVLSCHALTLQQHFTQPPPRFTEASLVKELEEQGIGRPSTYAPTIDVIQERGYVRKEDNRLHPTELGKTVDGVLREHFPAIVDIAFTADLEKRLDSIEEGVRPYEPTVREWYEPFDASVSNAETRMERVKVPARDTGETCPECGQGTLVVREGRFGQFIGCSRYLDCSYIKDRRAAPEPTGESCPNCGKPLVRRQGRRGPFVGCSGYPGCRYIQPSAEGGGENGRRAESQAEPTGEDCPDCGKPLVRRRGRFGPFVSCSGYPSCKYRPPRVAADNGRSRRPVRKAS